MPSWLDVDFLLFEGTDASSGALCFDPPLADRKRRLGYIVRLRGYRFRQVHTEGPCHITRQSCFLRALFPCLQPGCPNPVLVLLLFGLQDLDIVGLRTLLLLRGQGSAFWTVPVSKRRSSTWPSKVIPSPDGPSALAAPW